MTKRHGFTLLELLMVVIIIAILASIALPQYLRAAERTRATEALQILSAMRLSELRYRDQHPLNKFTGDPNELDTDIPGYGQPPLGPIPVSRIWNPYTVDVAAGNVVAARDSSATPPFGGSTIELDIVTGTTCASIDVYGLPVGLGC
jgi:prepilin-type N-terminal cleavage/methylation domain-containing protein